MASSRRPRGLDSGGSQVRLNEKFALITGASHGIGKMTALTFAREGADVAFTFRDREDGARDTVRQIEVMGRRALAIRAEVTEPNDCTRAVDQALADFGRLDILVNNAGGARGTRLLELSLDDWHYTLDLCLRAPFILGQRVARHMVEQGRGGAIVNISSVHSDHVWVNDAAYGVAKAGINRLTKSMAVEWAQYGIRANAIAPGYINVAENDEEEATYAATDGRAAPLIVSQRTARPREIADLALFLASDEASYVTGQTIFADGGLILPAITTADYMGGDRAAREFTG
jgi:NAD(P)-dependent dehydrogenase (short-subunit alcohol dehydrogenase family)